MTGQAFGINDQHQVIGRVFVASGAVPAVIWTLPSN
jgi:hypothetical protein